MKGGRLVPALLLLACAHVTPRRECANVQLPAEWTRLSQCEVASPDGAIHVRVSAATNADDATAINTAWSRWHPDVALKSVTPLLHPPPSGGWASTGSARFVTPDQHVVLAETRRADQLAWVVLAEGDEASLARRESQLDALFSSVGADEVKPERFVGQTPRELDAASLARFIDAAREQLGVPGVAVAVVSKDRVLFEKTSGVKTLGGTDAFGRHTRALIGSVTKPMSTLLQARLVDQHVLSWSSPVTQLLPGFAIGDAQLTQQLQLWHMSCACTGMPRRDLEHLFEFDGVTPEQRLASMKSMKPTSGLGEVFQYSNLMVAAGGFVAAHAFAPTASLTDAYRRAMHEQLFTPIGMSDARLDFAEATRGDVATPHAHDLDGVVRALPFAIEGNVVAIAPAGAVWASLADLERYAQVELNGGSTPEGTVIASRASWEERLKPRVKGASYGLGLDVDEVAGLRVIGHDGGSMGFGTSVYLLPELGLGLVVLTNSRHGGGALQLPFNEAMKRKWVELMFPSAQPIAQSLVTYALDVRSISAREGQGVERKPEAAWLAKLAGTWKHPTLGTVVIRGDVFDAGEWSSRFGRAGNALVLIDPPFAGTPFEIVEDGAALVVPDPQQPEKFRR